MIITIIINVKITLLHFLTSLIITFSNFSHYYIQIQSKNPSEGSYCDDFFCSF